MANRLAGESSPYLLQHADNPVDWYPWGEEAFARAHAEDRPVFLSIGYATCHWCHVMAHESFEDPETAGLLNDAFVCVKVDREERPDVDQVYMTVCQLLTGSGGWPLTIVMTPDRRPFYAATYLPRQGRWGRPGVMELVPKIRKMWWEKRATLESSAAEITRHLEAAAAPRSGDVDGELVAEAAAALAVRFDAAHGGFGSAPKFPSPHNLLLLLRRWRKAGDAHTLAMVETTLDAMWRGGIHDHLGGGFHRYSTDREWLVPHFEKMLYDQAMMLLAGTGAFRATRDPRHAELVRDIVGYLERDMTDAGGAFYSAEDADSDGEEGRFYVWSLAELAEQLGPEDVKLAAQVWGVTEAGNFRDEVSGGETSRNILHLPHSLADAAGRLELDEASLRERMARITDTLLAARSRRPRPLCDDKILTDWNGLAIAAIARAGAVLGEPSWVERAAAAADFLLTRLHLPNGTLLHRYRAGEAAVPGFLDDYACLCWGLTELYDATLEPARLVLAVELAEAMLERFWDDDDGGFFLTAADAEPLLVRPKDAYDGASPSGNSVAALVLVRLARLTGRADLEERAAAIPPAFAAALRQAPAGFSFLLTVMDEAASPSLQVVVVGEPGAADTRDLLAATRTHAPPGTGVLLVPQGPAGETVRRVAPFAAAYETVAGKATAYACRDFRCQLPVTQAHALAQLLSTSADE